MTRIIPTDKKGNVYYGPRTIKEAEEQIEAGADVTKVIQDVKEAGFKGIAARLTKSYF